MHSTAIHLHLPFIAILALIHFTISNHVSYDNYQVFRVLPEKEDQLQALQDLSERTDEFDFWKDVTAVGKHVDIMVGPNTTEKFGDFCNSTKLRSKRLIGNVQEIISNNLGSFAYSGVREFGWDTYQTLSNIYSWLESLPDKHPNVVKMITVGYSYENRRILGVKLSYSDSGYGFKKAVFLEGGIHPREWIAPATVTYILDQLLTSTDPKIRSIAEKHDWYIVPVANPDGYEYTHSTDRLWRKTRQPFRQCVGADANRNFDFHWGDTEGFNRDCSEFYPGPRAFSEPETSSLSSYLEGISNLQVYLSFHSYAQAILIPYGIRGERPHNFDELADVARAAARSLEQHHGTYYRVGNIVDIAYEAAGSSIDWVKAKLDVRFTYAFELRDTGYYGFMLPSSEIIPTGEETLSSVITLIEEADKRT